MKRKLGESIFPDNRQVGYQIGDDLAHQAALALAQRFDGPTLILLADALSFLNRVGGQAYIVTIRREVTADGRPVAEGEQGEFHTFGLAFHYESRDATVKLLKSPAEVAGIPVTDSSEATAIYVEETEPEVASPEFPPDDDSLRDEIEAEVAEALGSPAPVPTE